LGFVAFAAVFVLPADFTASTVIGAGVNSCEAGDVFVLARGDFLEVDVFLVGFADAISGSIGSGLASTGTISC
tara:strand:- start:15 stop:233 length:219 start_codon:yes stop_codon:yes gene_type:complete